MVIVFKLIWGLPKDMANEIFKKCNAYMAPFLLSEVVGEVLSDVLNKMVGVLGVQVQHLIQSPQINALQITICQCFHVCTCLYHPVFH